MGGTRHAYGDRLAVGSFADQIVGERRARVERALADERLGRRFDSITTLSEFVQLPEDLGVALEEADDEERQ